MILRVTSRNPLKLTIGELASLGLGIGEVGGYDFEVIDSGLKERSCLMTCKCFEP